MKLLACLCLMFALLVSCAAPPDPEAAIRKGLETYLAALDAADTNLAAQVWRTSADVSMIHPAGHAHGWEEVQAFYKSFGTMFSERKLTSRDVSIHVNGDTAWAEYYWHFDAKMAGGPAIQSDGRESQVWAKTGDRWEIVHVHYSGPAMTFQP